MKKSMFKKLVGILTKRVKHGGGGFSKMISNPAGSKFRKQCDKHSARGADGTMR